MDGLGDRPNSLGDSVEVCAKFSAGDRGSSSPRGREIEKDILVTDSDRKVLEGCTKDDAQPEEKTLENNSNHQRT